MRKMHDSEDGPWMRLAKWVIPALLWTAGMTMVAAGVMAWTIGR